MFSLKICAQQLHDEKNFKTVLQQCNRNVWNKNWCMAFWVFQLIQCKHHCHQKASPPASSFHGYRACSWFLVSLCILIKAESISKYHVWSDFWFVVLFSGLAWYRLVELSLLNYFDVLQKMLNHYWHTVYIIFGNTGCV